MAYTLRGAAMTVHPTAKVRRDAMVRGRIEPKG